VRNSTHLGAVTNYAKMALEHDMIGIALTTGGIGVVAPGATKAAVGTNPLAVAAPAGKYPPFVLDMATSVVAGGKLLIAGRNGEAMPEGWVIDKEGKPVTDPVKAFAGIWTGDGGILPLGGTPALGVYKGFGLGVLIEILCGVLSGSETGKRGRAGSHFFGALRIDTFTPVENFKKSMDELMDVFEALPKLPGVKHIYTAGRYEAGIEKEREANGIPLQAKVVETLQGMAKEIGIKYNL